MTLKEYLEGPGGYQEVKFHADGRWAGLFQFMFTWAVITGRGVLTYDDRWCYATREKAKASLDAWDMAPGTEPQGWHRHPATGRRVDEHGHAYVAM